MQITVGLLVALAAWDDQVVSTTFTGVSHHAGENLKHLQAKPADAQETLG